MSDSLRDQLLGLGYKPAPKPERQPERKPEASARPAHGARRDQAARPGGADRSEPRKPGQRPEQRRPDQRKPEQRTPDQRARRPAHAKPSRSQEEIDLGKAYALRAQKEKDDRIETERLKQEEAKRRREAKAALAILLQDKSLNDPAAEIARHFEYGGKIKRIYVTPAQLTELNAGHLGVAQMDGRYLLVPMALLLEAEAIFPPAVALKVDPNALAADDPYSDPAYQVPDDLVW